MWPQRTPVFSQVTGESSSMVLRCGECKKRQGCVNESRRVDVMMPCLCFSQFTITSLHNETPWNVSHVFYITNSTRKAMWDWSLH